MRGEGRRGEDHEPIRGGKPLGGSSSVPQQLGPLAASLR